MRSWPSWVATVLGALLLIVGLWMGYGARDYPAYAPLTLAGAVLLGLGLHALQGTYDAWCATCDWDGCGCDHCAGCAEGDCCGHCGCDDMETHEGHEGHQH